MPKLEVSDNASLEMSMRRLKRMCEKEGVFSNVKAKEAYEKPSSKRQRKKAAAIKRNKKKLQKEKDSLMSQRRHM